jgi:stage V sporulation protein D (sporulation-specific penicillin-binding protein)
MEYVRNFGFGRKTGIDLPGETVGVMFSRIGPVELATMSFGQGPSVTPIQQVVAMSAIANDGKVLKPFLVDQVMDNDGNVILQNQTTVVGQAVKPETAARMRVLLESVVAEGGGQNAYIPGYRLAGKTGTAQVPKPGGGYYASKYIASFNGFAPANDPKVVIFFAIKDPKGKYGYYGANTAAPSVRAIAQDILYYLDVKPQTDAATAPEAPPVAVPQLVGLTPDGALEALRDTGLNIRLDGAGGKILDQTPKAGVKVAPGSTVIVYLGEQPSQVGQPVPVPNVQGLSLRDAGVKLSAAGLQMQALGSGVASSQSPAAGVTVPAGSLITVNFVP